MSENKGVYKSVFPGKFIQGEGLISGLPDMMKTFGEWGLILASPTAKKKVLDKYSGDYATRGILLEEFGGECSQNEISRVSAIAAKNNTGVIAGAGGRKGD